jgi:hypothetical protein
MGSYKLVQADPVNPAASNYSTNMQTLFKQLSKLRATCGARAASSEQILMESRAHTVMCEVPKRSWEEYRASCTRELAVACQLWSQAENLVVRAAELDDLTLLEDSQEMMCLCDHLMITSEEEIIELNDLGTETYVFAHEHGTLVWQKSTLLS